MGYYSTLTTTVSSDTEVKPFELSEVSYKDARKNKEEYKYYFGGVSVDKEGNFDVPEWTAKWYQSQGFAQFLSKQMVKGRITLHFEGEDGEEWSYVVEPDAAVEKGDLGDVVWVYGEHGKELALRVLDEEIASWEEHVLKLKNQKSEIEKSQ